MSETIKQFSLTLDQVLRGESVLKNPNCEFSYHWDFEKNMGLAQLISINGTHVNITLHPLGIAGQLDFMSDMQPTKFMVNATNDESIALVEVVIYRVILDTDEKGQNPKAAIMFGMDGDTILTSAGFNEGSAAKELPPVAI
ncbi:MAG: hypothetical protein HWE22_15660 [Flavobacteriales bacterium]|nr:hypothetical protein [Flavobacteriales bacterium]